jgi:hypothetical protein
MRDLDEGDVTPFKDRVFCRAICVFRPMVAKVAARCAWNTDLTEKGLDRVKPAIKDASQSF